jgi:hypothetical protein
MHGKFGKHYDYKNPTEKKHVYKNKNGKVLKI